jgi:predicted nucleotidyltransferase
MSEIPDLDVVGTKEAAALLGVSPSNFVRDWADRPGFPKPVIALDRRRLWERDAVLTFARSVGPRRGARLSSLPLSPQARRWLPTIKRTIVRIADPERIVLFGSQARGEARSDSDIDLLVIVPEGRDVRDLSLAVRTALADVPIAKDVFITTPARVERYGDVIGSLVEPALREGTTIHARA